MTLPISPWAITTMRRPPRPVWLPNTRPSQPFFSSRCSFSPTPIPTCTIVISTRLFAKLAWICGFANCRPLCMCPMKYAGIAIHVPRICNGTCQRERTIPRTMPVGKMRPKERTIRRMCVQSTRSRGSGEVAAPSGILSWPPWAEVGVVKRRGRRMRRRGDGRRRDAREGAMVVIDGRRLGR